MRIFFILPMKCCLCSSPLSRCSSALLFLLLLASIQGTPAPCHPAPEKTQDTSVHDETLRSASEKEAMSYPTKTVSKRSIFDLIPYKVRKGTAHQKKNRKVLNRARSKYKKVDLRHLIRKAFRSYYNHRRRKNHKRGTTTFATTANISTTTTASTTSTTSTAAATTTAPGLEC